MKALIVDDEFKAAEILSLLIEHHVPEIREAITALGAQKATVLLDNFQPDLVFLDIKMPGMNGFEWLRHLGKPSFEVIFTTAYDQ